MSNILADYKPSTKVREIESFMQLSVLAKCRQQHAKDKIEQNNGANVPYCDDRLGEIWSKNKMCACQVDDQVALLNEMPSTIM